MIKLICNINERNKTNKAGLLRCVVFLFQTIFKDKKPNEKSLEYGAYH